MAELVKAAPAAPAPFNIVRMSHVEYVVTDIKAARHFYVDTLGLVLSAETGDALFLRALEERGHHSIRLTEGPVPATRCIGFRVFTDQDLDLAAEFFASRNLPVEWARQPFMGRVLRTRDPWGVPLEFYAEMQRLPTLHQSYGRYRGVKPLRIDHANLFAPDVDGAAEFYAGLGFRLTEYTEDEESGRKWAAWLQRKGNVHDIAFTNGRGPRLHHCAFWIANPLHIIEFLDLISTTGYLANIERGPGRHGISNAFFLYVTDPDGHRIELYSSDYQTVDPDHEPIKWDLRDPTRQTLWGAPAPRSWFEEGTQFEDVACTEPVNAGTPIIAP
ncbi:MAG: 3,4-dihydroxyphenylacetate 2,3-dioxygenase [Rhodobacteraceae bacterium]|nr:3,4-dihydroxyphenylacetate 2,3-dioxygenase [Paracoccaceae bacterium]